MKKLLTGLLAGLVMFTGTAFASDFKWSECWCTYGAGIEKGDIIVNVDAGMPWSVFDTINAGGWAIPTIIAEVQVAQPIWKLPFTFGGYFTYDYSSIPTEGWYYANGEHKWGKTKLYHSVIATGGSATYHFHLPPKGLDLYSGLKMGLKIDISNIYSNNVNLGFDWGMNIGANWFFNDTFGLNLEFGYPYTRFGAAFKF